MRARHVTHHTSAYVWHRDDREGHEGPRKARRHWWSHDWRKWMSWQEIVDFVNEGPERYVLEHLYAPPQFPGCAPDGPHTDRCPPQLRW